jgi:glycosyltransferase involved in cell wall biosynthesis
MKKKILVTGPATSRSGYGEMCRLALAALKNREDLYDIYISPTKWGATGSILEENEETKWIEKIINKTQQIMTLTKGQIKFDVSIQVTIPNEWKKIAAYNIGYTAGIETNFVSPAWLDPSNAMDKIITISEHAKASFQNTIFGDNKGNTYRVNTPISVVHFPIKTFDSENQLELGLTSDFNFLAVCQWGPRKNLEQLVSAFVEEFRDEDVGLVVKTNSANDSIIDKCNTEARMTNLIKNLGSKKCKVHLLHGTLTESQINSLYTHPKIKAYASSTHGEGYGIPMFEAMYNEMPVIAPGWSGHLDFLTMPNEQGKAKNMFAAVDYELKPISEQHVWQGVLEKGTSWAYPSQSSLRTRLREVVRDYTRFKGWAKKLAQHNKDKFSKDNIHSSFINALGA